MLTTMTLRPLMWPSLVSRQMYSSKKKSVGAALATVSKECMYRPPPVVPFPKTPRRSVPPHICRPPYADKGVVPVSLFPERILIHDTKSADKMRQAARLARKVLDHACSLAKPGVTTDEIDKEVHEAIIACNAYPSPLNYAQFPKSVCSSINEVICHGIPDTRPLEIGDIVAFDVSCFLNGVHGDNCATVIVGDEQVVDDGGGCDWRGVPFKMGHDDDAVEAYFQSARRLVHATRESLYAAVDVCRPGANLSEIGSAVHAICDAYGYDSVQKYRGHGIAHEFHMAPFVKHFLNNDRCELLPGMIFTIEPMLTEGNSNCREWVDNWTVVTDDGSLSAQFEHTVLITETGVEILTLPESEW